MLLLSFLGSRSMFASAKYLVVNFKRVLVLIYFVHDFARLCFLFPLLQLPSKKKAYQPLAP